MGFEPANIINGATGYDKTHAVHTTPSASPLRHRLSCAWQGRGLAGEPAGAEWKHAAFEPSPPFLSTAAAVRKSRRQAWLGTCP